tara:strand:+ start:36 stop:287 length:252 start_codon:yes stop_codon:yes gene_type:complete
MNKWIDELTMASYESEIDLDRDVPDESYYDSLMTTGFDVDVDENGPFITALDEAELEDEFDFDAYCDEHPDFNAALNGHPDYI